MQDMILVLIALQLDALPSLGTEMGRKPTMFDTSIEGALTNADDLMRGAANGAQGEEAIDPLSETFLVVCYAADETETVIDIGDTGIIVETELAPAPITDGSGLSSSVPVGTSEIGNLTIAFDQTLTGSSNPDVLIGGSRSDLISGFGGDDVLRGKGGSDFISGGGGADSIMGNSGRDFLFGNAGDDVIRAGTGNDVAKGGAGNDKINGGAGADTLSGGNGDDTIIGRTGDDKLRGGNGEDVFQFRASDRNDTILDFTQGEDRIEILSGANEFSDLSIEQDGAHVLISFGAGQVTVISDDAAAFDASDFIF